MYVILKQTGDRSLLSLNFLDEADFSNKDELATRNIRILEHYDDDSSHWTTYVNDAQMFDDYDEAYAFYMAEKEKGREVKKPEKITQGE